MNNSPTGVSRHTTLDQEALHGSLGAPVMGAMDFLNDVIGRFPTAISFAPGAPFEEFFDEIDIARHIAVYRDYLQRTKGMGPAQVARHLYQYGPSRGHINELIATAMAIDENMSVDAGDIVVTVGCQEAMLLVVRALCGKPDDQLAVVDPSFVGIAGAARLLDVDVVPIDETEDGIDLSMLQAACGEARRRGRRIKALYVAPDFSNPSGTRMAASSRHQLLALAEAEDFLILEDNAYGFTARPGTELPTLKSLDRNRRVVYLGTCAKMCLPGVRVGFLIADQLVSNRHGQTATLARQLASVKSMITVNTSPICQAIVAGMLLEHGCSFKQIAADKAELYRRNLSLLMAALERELGADPAFASVSWNAPQGGFFVRMQLPVEIDSNLLEKSARDYGVLWTPMRSFALTTKRNHGLRLSCSYLEPKQIDAGIERLARFIREQCLGTASMPPAGRESSYG